jgi:O-antigen/teichoic acid export membrane protein
LLPALVGLATVPLMVKGLGTEAYGAFALAWVLLGYFTVFDLGLGRATTHAIASDLARGAEGGVRHLVSQGLVFQLALGAAGAFLLASLAPWFATRVAGADATLRHEVTTSLLLLAAALPFVLATATLAGVLEGMRRFVLLNAVRIPASLAVLVLPALAVWRGGGVLASVVALVIARVAGTVAFAIVVHRVAPADDGRPPAPGVARRLFGFGGWLTVSNIVSPLMVHSDRFILGVRGGLTDIAHYSVPYDVITRLWILPSSLSAVLFPEFSALATVRDRERTARLLRRATGALALGVGAIVAVAIPAADPLLALWMGREFADAAVLPARILLVGVLVNSLAWVPMSYLQGAGRPDLPARSHVIQLPLYAFALWYGVGRWGIAGAAAAWLLRVTVDAALLFALAARELRRAL